MRLQCVVLILIPLMLCTAFGCAQSAPEKAQVEGRIICDKNRPVPNLKITARLSKGSGSDLKIKESVQPDGVFRFDNLQPETEYILEPLLKDHAFAISQAVTTGKAGTTTFLQKQIFIRWMRTPEGLVHDFFTGCDWLEDPGKDFTWEEAAAYVKKLTAGGHADWKLPPPLGLSYIFDKQGPNNCSRLFNLQHRYVWTEEPCSSGMAKSMDFAYGLSKCDITTRRLGVLAVRDPK